MRLKSCLRPAPGTWRHRRPVDFLYLKRLLLRKPPSVEWVSGIEIYLLKADGTRARRICGMSHGQLQTFVPKEMNNPHGVVNPREQYLCTNAAGAKTEHKGIGPCLSCSNTSIDMGDGTTAWWHKKRDVLLRSGFMSASSLEGAMAADRFLSDDPEDASQGAVKIDLEEYERLARAKYTPEQLLDTMRSLYQMEAVKLAVMDTLKRDGVSLERLRTVSDQIVKSAQYQAAMAKRDLILMQGKAVEAITRALVTGMLAIVIDALGRDQAIGVLSRFRQELVLPVNEQGFTELLRRQQAAGMTDLVASLLKTDEDDDVEFIDLDPGEADDNDVARLDIRGK